MIFLLRLNKVIPFLAILLKVRWFKLYLNKKIINNYARCTTPRPRPLSLLTSYTSWKSLTDKTYTGRHLPPDTSNRKLPPIDDVVSLWRREDKKEILSNDTSMLFSFFAQWFTDSFLRTNLKDRKKNSSNHEIDFCQLYGMNEQQTNIIRLKEGGKLKYQEIDGEIFPPFLFDPEKTTKKEWVFARPEFEELHDREKLELIFQTATDETIKYMFVTGLEHGNSNVGYTLLTVIALREHNRICEELAKEYPEWDDEQLFQTTRNIMIVLLLKIVAGDYIKHIATFDFPFEVIPGFAEKEKWYRSNWITLEFDLLYRWHSMVPEKLMVGDTAYKPKEYRSNPALLLKHGVGKFVTSASHQLAGKIGLKNTPDFFFHPLPAMGSEGNPTSIHKNTVLMGRNNKLQPMNEYREAFGLQRMKSFEELTDDPQLLSELKKLYPTIDDVEWHVGIFAESHGEGQMIGDLMTQMVAYDAFTHALTNPLLSENIYNEVTFSAKGLEIIEQTTTFSEFIKRNITDPSDVHACFNARQQVPGSYGLPLLGVIYDTLDFIALSGWKQFFEKRRKKYKSTIFKVNLFEPTIVVMDKAGFDIFHNWDGKLRKDYGFGWAVPPAALTQGKKPTIFHANPMHEKYKSLYMDILKDKADSFSETFDENWSEYTARWVQVKQFSMAEEIEKLTVSFVFNWYFDDLPNVDDVRYVYNNIFLHIPLWLRKLLLWSSYNKSIPKSVKLHQFVQTSSSFPKFSKMAEKYGLTDKQELISQLTFLTGMNNYLGLQGMSKALIGELTCNPDIVDQLRDEFTRLEKSKSVKKLSLKDLCEIELLNNVMKEIMRLHPPVFFIYGRANDDFILNSSSGTFSIKKDEHLMGVIPLVQTDKINYDDPLSFKPERFTHVKNNDALIWPHGLHADAVDAKGHICPGKDVAILYGKRLCYELVQNFSWEFADPIEWDDKKFSLNVASPKGAMRTRSFTRQENR